MFASTKSEANIGHIHGRSEVNLQGHLCVARVIRLRVAEQPETRVINSCLCLTEPWGVEGIERLEPELGFDPFCDVKALEERRLQQSKSS